jgi:hypothetical protein
MSVTDFLVMFFWNEHEKGGAAAVAAGQFVSFWNLDP